MPTLAEIISVTCPPTDGISFLPTLLGNKAGQKEHEYLYWEYPDPKIGNKAIRMGKWKGIITNIRQGNTEMQLYDLDADLREEHDVAAQHPDIVAKFRQLMEESSTPTQQSRTINYDHEYSFSLHTAFGMLLRLGRPRRRAKAKYVQAQCHPDLCRRLGIWRLGMLWSQKHRNSPRKPPCLRRSGLRMHMPLLQPARRLVTPCSRVNMPGANRERT